MSNNLLVVCHASDLDGACSQAIARKALGQDAEYATLEYGDEIPEGFLGRRLLFMDVVPSPFEKLGALLASGADVSVIDHHDSFLESEWASKVNLIAKPAPEEKKQLSACGLAWRHFFPHEPMPEAVRLLTLYDAWADQSPEWLTRILPFQEYAKSAGRMLDFSIPETAALWATWLAAFMEQVERWIETGKAVLNRKNQTLPDLIRKQAFPATLAGKRFMAVNMAYLNSMYVQDYLNDPNLDGALGFFFTGTCWKLRVLSKRFHCGRFCTEQFGGGGHEEVGGFTSPNMAIKAGVILLSD